MSSQWSQEAARQWDSFAADWHKRSEQMWEKGSRSTILPFFMRHVAPGRGPILDAGCGDGYASCKLAGHGYTVEGVDIAGEMIRLAEERKSISRKMFSFRQQISASCRLQMVRLQV